MQEHKVILTWEAIYDLTDIADYIERDFGKNRADRFEKEIKQQIKDIGYMGGIYGNTHIHYRSYSIFKKAFPPSIIFYVIKELENEIHILRVLREERDWKNILKEQQNYTYPK
ncbi:MAG: type II toxin-antitoxin system RelE/ParE family toxin [Clostridium sp.]|nr:type II toxin-antitoxin system RelE/ParE family toxin [Clostridium sp.]MCM1171745.1 type II toxin-antitoxin system RelE/ParE family toxin [Clostridium sp.]MCM1208216.1 type II toxin-antitoxin system RelE/ParE family toxin [Ruminococcus sp.]